jgi:hypothetical protein
MPQQMRCAKGEVLQGLLFLQNLTFVGLGNAMARSPGGGPCSPSPFVCGYGVLSRFPRRVVRPALLVAPAPDYGAGRRRHRRQIRGERFFNPRKPSPFDHYAGTLALTDTGALVNAHLCVGDSLSPHGFSKYSLVRYLIVSCRKCRTFHKYGRNDGNTTNEHAASQHARPR